MSATPIYHHVALYLQVHIVVPRSKRSDSYYILPTFPSVDQYKRFLCVAVRWDIFLNKKHNIINTHTWPLPGTWIDSKTWGGRSDKYKLRQSSTIQFIVVVRLVRK